MQCGKNTGYGNVGRRELKETYMSIFEMNRIVEYVFILGGIDR